MSIEVKNSLISSLESTFDAEFSLDTILGRNLRCALSFLGTMGVTSIIGTHTTLDSLGSFEAALLGDLLWKWQFIMSLSSFQNVFKPRAYLVLLLCNAKWSMSLLPSICLWVHNFLINIPAFAPTIVFPWNPLSPFLQLYLVQGPFWPWQKWAYDYLSWYASGRTCCTPSPTCANIAMHMHLNNPWDAPTHHNHDYYKENIDAKNIIC